MNASLLTLPTASSSVEGAALLKGDVSSNQQLGSELNGFGPLLQQAVGALGESPEGVASNPDLLPESLQILPLDGKLLPLLQQVLDAAEAGGTEPSAVLENLAAKLQQLPADTNLDPEKVIATALQQFIDDNPRIAASVDTGLLRGLSAQSLPVTDRDSGTRTQTGLTPHKFSAEGVTVNTGLTTAERAADLAQQRSVAGPEKITSELLPVTPEQREAALRNVAEQLKRLESGTANNRSPEVLTRSEGLLPMLAPAISSAATPALPGTAAAQPGTGLPSLSLNVPFNQAGWDKALGERIQWMAGKGVQSANIKLNPAHLGPMEVRIQIQNEQASVQFSSAHGVVREALEAALPRLREMFDASGVELADVDVSDQSFAEQRQAGLDAQGRADSHGQNDDSGSDGSTDTILETPLYSLPASGRLDLFA